MDQARVLRILKMDLKISNNAYDDILIEEINLAKDAIEREGVQLDPVSTSDDALVRHYAAFLYRTRSDKSAEMPRSLRYMLNNRLLSEKAKTEE